MNKKEIVVVIRGANYIKSNIRFLQKIILFIYRKFNVVPDYSKSKERWFSKLKRKNRELIYFNWSGKFWPWDICSASKRLKRVIENKENIKIVCCSLGTQIAFKTLRKSSNITKIISICGVYRKINSGIIFVDLRSNLDLFVNTARFFFNFLSFVKMNSTTISLEKMRHDEFHKDKKVPLGKFKGKRISDIINLYLK